MTNRTLSLHITRTTALLLAALTFAPAAYAQAPAWKPERSVEIVVGSAPGGNNDKVGRTLLRIWQENKWLENATVVNKVGGGGAVAYNYTSQQAGDGHHVVVVRTGLLSNHVLGLSKINHNDLTPLALVADEAMSIAVRADSPLRGARDLVARWKTDPQSVSISLGSSRGSTTHFLLAGVAKLSGVDARKLKTITFGGAADSMTNLLGGHIDMVSLAVNNLIAQHKAGAIRIIGIASENRLALLPEVPTLREQGFDVVVGGWTALMGPPRMTAAQIAYWEDLIERSLNQPQWRRLVETDSIEWQFRKSQATRDFLRKDYDTIRSLLTDLGMAK